jgi:hypothetical protein
MKGIEKLRQENPSLVEAKAPEEIKSAEEKPEESALPEFSGIFAPH